MPVNLQPPWSLIWHGCEIKQVFLTSDNHICFELSVASVTTADGTHGFLKGVTLEWSGGQCQTDTPLSDVLGGVSDGHWLINGAIHKRMPIPSILTGHISSTVRLICGTELCVQGHECRVSVAPDAQFQESMAC